jgi:hypothetical protein
MNTTSQKIVLSQSRINSIKFDIEKAEARLLKELAVSADLRYQHVIDRENKYIADMVKILNDGFVIINGLS